jgi:hypothetical protein
MTEIRLNRVSSQASIAPVDRQEFYARMVPIPAEALPIVEALEKKHAILRKWMNEAYALNPVAHNKVELEFPKELLEDGEKVEAKDVSKKGRPAKRIRDGSDGDAKTARG